MLDELPFGGLTLGLAVQPRFGDRRNNRHSVSNDPGGDGGEEASVAAADGNASESSMQYRAVCSMKSSMQYDVSFRRLVAAAETAKDHDRWGARAKVLAIAYRMTGDPQAQQS